ncbi:MAG: TonB family protein [Vicinamibacteraceae bacterium]
MSRLSRFFNVFRLQRLERELDEELRFHVQLRIEQNLKRGMTPEQAEGDAHSRFGSIDRAKAGMRDARILRGFEATVRSIERRGGGHRRAAAAVLACASVVLVGVLALSPYWRASVPVFDVGHGVSAPVPVEERLPTYTAAALHAKIQGTVRVQCVVQANGTCSDVQVVRSLDPRLGLDEEALRAARQWRFRPGLRKGTPVPTRVMLDMRFALR